MGSGGGASQALRSRAEPGNEGGAWGTVRYARFPPAAKRRQDVARCVSMGYRAARGSAPRSRDEFRRRSLPGSAFQGGARERGGRVYEASADVRLKMTISHHNAGNSRTDPPRMQIDMAHKTKSGDLLASIVMSGRMNIGY